jgi:uncharacterized membrane protein
VAQELVIVMREVGRMVSCMVLVFIFMLPKTTRRKMKRNKRKMNQRKLTALKENSKME